MSCVTDFPLILSDDRLYSESLSRIISADPAAVAPGIAVIDSRMADALARCVEVAASHAVVIVGVADDDMAQRALMAGARGIVYKTEPAEHVVKAIELVRSGGIWAPRRVVAAAFAQAIGDQRHRTGAAALVRRLSQRERDVFYVAASGAGNKQIADHLSISEATVKVHLTHIFKKLGIQSRGQLAAAYHGLLRQ
ncbi:MAG TPA: response regulator transcription factor [Vicinamibacterales bacterium]|nr:response regulator transcription factor [Vicinamibacterales bacterium]